MSNSLYAILYCVLLVITGYGSPASSIDNPILSGSSGPSVLRPSAGDEIRGARDIPFRFCPPGKFRKGSPADEHGRFPDENQVDDSLEYGFYCAETEITRAVYFAVMNDHPWDLEFDEDTRRYPATHITWTEAVDFCDRLTREEHKSERLAPSWKYSLPTEAQWEYACRAGTQTTYSYGDSPDYLPEYAWFGRQPNSPSPVGLKTENAWGLHDVHGNVYEWCLDFYHEDHGNSLTSKFKVLRGGSWSSDARNCRSASRMRMRPDKRTLNAGFRIVLVQIPSVVKK